MFWLYVGAVFGVVLLLLWLYERRRGATTVDLRNPSFQRDRNRGIEGSIRNRHGGTGGGVGGG